MNGIFPWETLPNSYFIDSISWEFTCLDRSTDDYIKLEEFWLPDDHDLRVRSIIKFNSMDDKMQRVLSAEVVPKWMLSWSSTGTNRCGSSELVSHHREYVDVVCIIPAGSCAKNLIIEPVAICVGGRRDKDGLFLPPPGAILTMITPLILTFGEGPAFPLYEKSGDGKELLKWSVPQDLSENLHEDMSRLIAVEVDLNHKFLKAYPGEIKEASQQKKGLLYQMIICDYIRIICADEDVLWAIDEKSFAFGTAGYSINWLLTELAGYCNFSGIVDLSNFFRKNPTEITKTVDKVFSQLLSI